MTISIIGASQGLAVSTGTIPMRLHGVVLENTLPTAVYSPTVSGLLSCLSYGQGAPICEDGGMAVGMFSTPCPPFVLENAKRGLSILPYRSLNHE